MENSTNSETNNPDNSANTQTANPDSDSSANPEVAKFGIEHFVNTLVSAIMVLIVVAFLMVAAIWIWGDSKILFVQPLTISLSDCEPDAERCYVLDDPTTGSFGATNYISVITIVKFAVTIVTAITALFYYNHNPFITDRTNKPISWSNIWMLLNKVLIAAALALFSWIVFSAIEVFAGLAALDNNPQLMLSSVAILTVAVFVSVISFLLIEWIRDIDIVDIGRAGIVTLIVSYSLSIPLASHNWNDAYSVLGAINSSAVISGGNGSEMLFKLTMLSLGLIFIAFASNVAYIFHDTFKNSPIPFWQKLWVLIFGALAGLGSIVVGFVPTNLNSEIHNIGAYGGVLFSVALGALLMYIYWKFEGKNTGFKQLWQLGLIVIVVGAGAIVLIKAAMNDSLLPGVLELEFAYFFLFLLFIQIYSTFLISYIARSPGLPNHKDYRQQEAYLNVVAAKALKTIAKRPNSKSVV